MNGEKNRKQQMYIYIYIHILFLFFSDITTCPATDLHPVQGVPNINWDRPQQPFDSKCDCVGPENGCLLT